MPKLLDPHNENVGAVLNCAVRYACGRQTYMPSIVIGVITPIISELSDNILCCMERDIRNQQKYGYGDECDKINWMNFLALLTKERKDRGLEVYL